MDPNLLQERTEANLRAGLLFGSAALWARIALGYVPSDNWCQGALGMEIWFGRRRPTLDELQARRWQEKGR